MYTTDSARWHATSTRAPASSTAFVYAVKTTRIFCRPTCRARLARRSNVAFYDTAADALAAGFRACKRCKPLLDAWEPERELMRGVCARLESVRREGKELGLEAMAREAGLSKWHFWRVFRREVGCTPREWVLMGKRREAGGSGRESDSGLEGEVEEGLIGEFGASSSSSASSLAGSGEGLKAVCYTTIPTAHGVLLVAFLQGRICKLDLTGSEQEARENLHAAYPCEQYTLSPLLSDGEMFLVAAEVAEAVERPSGRTLSLSLSDDVLDCMKAVEGTA